MRILTETQRKKGLDLLRYVEEHILWIVLLAAQVIFLVVTGFLYNETSLDCDAAKLYYHTMQFWDNGILLGDWTYMTTMEMDCASLFALPFYGITRNIYLAFNLSNVLFIAIFLVVFFDLGRRLGLKRKYICMSCILLFMPYAYGMLEYVNMMFFNGSQYVIKALAPVLLIDLLLAAGGETHRAWDWVLFGFECFFLFLTGVCSGVYVFVCGVLPLLLCALFRCLILKTVKATPFGIALVGGSTGASVLGIVVNFLFAGAKGNEMKLVFGDMWGHLVDCFTGIFQVFGATNLADGTKILSASGIRTLILTFFVLALLVCVVAELHRCVKKREVNASWWFLSLFFWNLLVLVFSDPGYDVGYPYRYHIIGLVGVFVLVGIILSRLDTVQRTSLRRFLRIGVSCALILVMAATNHAALGLVKEDKTVQSRTVCEKMEELGVDTVFVLEYSPLAELCRTLDTDREYINCLSSGRSDANYDYFISRTDAAFFADRQKNALISWNDTLFERLPDYIKSHYTFFAETDVGLKIYLSEVNYFDGPIGLPTAEVSFDYPDLLAGYGGYGYTGTITENRSLIAQGGENFILCTPVLGVSRTAFACTFRYQSAGHGEIGYVEIRRGGVPTGERIPLFAEAGALEIPDLTSNNDLQLFVYLNEGESLELSRIEYRYQK